MENIFSLKGNSNEVSEMDLIHGSFELGTQIQNKHTKLNLTYVDMENCMIKYKHLSISH